MACAEQSIELPEFPDLASFKKAQQEAGFVVIGNFEKMKIAWPATVVEERTAKDEISFIRADGGKNSYPGFDGYTLKVLRLRGAKGKESVRVYRSKNKR